MDDRSIPTLDAEAVWQPERRVPARDRNVRYRPALPALIGRHPPHVSDEVRALAEQAALDLRSADDRGATGPFIVPLLRSESAASSKIEQIDVGQRYIGRAMAGYPVKQRAAREVGNNIDAVRAALDHAASPLDVDALHGIHRTLLPDEPWAGSLRDVQNWIGGSDHSPRGARYVPPAPERVRQLVDDLCVYADRDDLPAVVQAGIVHAQFEAIHPYADGNGRVGRSLVHRVLRRRNVVRHGVAPVSVAMLARRDAYLDDLAAFDEGDADTFCAGFARSAARAAAASLQLTSDLRELAQEWQELPIVTKARRDATIRRLVVELIEHPVVDARWVAERFEVSNRTALNALEPLVEAGVLNRTTAAKGLYIFEATDVFTLIEGIEADLRDRE